MKPMIYVCAPSRSVRVCWIDEVPFLHAGDVASIVGDKAIAEARRLPGDGQELRESRGFAYSRYLTLGQVRVALLNVKRNCGDRAFLAALLRLMADDEDLRALHGELERVHLSSQGLSEESIARWWHALDLFLQGERLLWEVDELRHWARQSREEIDELPSDALLPPEGAVTIH